MLPRTMATGARHDSSKALGYYGETDRCGYSSVGPGSLHGATPNSEPAHACNRIQAHQRRACLVQGTRPAHRP